MRTAAYLLAFSLFIVLAGRLLFFVILHTWREIQHERYLDKWSEDLP